ncbi:protein kinase domain-containing protein [Kangiella marina]|uniref:non-specific serine/threonine protein kinase n=1 Tax=Kangiella marina TaxID=1079178 RepID=A0ABP8IB86_9GAMM
MGNDDLDKETKSDSLSETQVLSKPATLKADALLAGRFKVLSLQGCGKFGCVYKAKDLQLDSLVAVKVLHSHLVSAASLQHFKNEILTLRQLSHPNIVRVHEYYEDADHHFITMDWIDGEHLGQWLDSNRSSSKELLNSFIEQILGALQATEAKGIKHKDLKPENILIDDNHQLYIADFGIASAVGDANSGVIAGSPLYSPPEYLQAGKVTLSIDIYAFGLILHEIIVGRSPYQSRTQSELIKEKLSTSKLKLPKQYSGYQETIQRCIAPIAESRPKSVADVKKLLSSSTASASHSPLKRSGLFLMLITTVVILGVGTLFWWSGSGGKGVAEVAAASTVENNQSLVVLPFETKPQKGDEWLTEGLPLLLSDELSQISNLRVVSFDRSRRTLDLLGYQQPLDDAKLKVVSDLTQSPYLLTTKLIPTGPTQFQVSARLVHVSGHSLTVIPLAQFSSNKNELSKDFNQLIQAIQEHFDLETIDSTESGFSQVNLQAIAEIGILLQQGEEIRAKERLNSLLVTLPDYAKGWFQLGRLEAQAGGVLEAEQAFAEALKHSAENSLTHKRTTAELQLLAEDYEQAIQTYLSILKQLPNHHDIRFELAQLYTEQQSFELAQNQLERIVTQDENHPSAWYELAKVSIWQGNTQEAVDNYLVKALVTAKKLKNTQLEGDVLNAFGVAYHRLGKLDMALDYYQQGLSSREASDDTRGVVTSLSNLASVFAIKGEYEQAEHSLVRALKVNQSRNDSVKQADLFNELGVIAEEQGMYHKALEQFRASLSIRMKLDDDWLKAESLNNVAYIFFLLSDVEQATIYWEQAKAYYEKVEDPVGVLRVNENMAQLELQKGQWQSAYQMYQSALDKAQELNLYEESIVAKAYLAKIAFLQGNFIQPTEQLFDIKSELKDRQDIRGQVEFGLWLIEWFTAYGDYQQAESLLVDILPLLEEENNRSQQLIYDAFSARLERYQGRAVVQTEPASLTQVTAKAALETLIYQLEAKLISDQVDTDVESIQKSFGQYDLDLHKYYQLRKLILMGFISAQKGDVDALKVSLDKLMLLKRGVGTYWRHYQIDRLQAIYYQLQNQPTKSKEYAQSAHASFTELLQQLSEQQRQNLISLQGRYYRNDDFMELVNDKE